MELGAQGCHSAKPSPTGSVTTPGVSSLTSIPLQLTDPAAAQPAGGTPRGGHPSGKQQNISAVGAETQQEVLEKILLKGFVLVFAFLF